MQKKFFLWKRLRLELIFTRFWTFFSSDVFSSRLYLLWSYFLRLNWQPPYYFRKKSPKNSKHMTLFPVTFFQGLEKIRPFFPQFLFPGFFPGTFLHRFTLVWYFSSGLPGDQPSDCTNKQIIRK